MKKKCVCRINCDVTILRVALAGSDVPLIRTNFLSGAQKTWDSGGSCMLSGLGVALDWVVLLGAAAEYKSSGRSII